MSNNVWVYSIQKNTKSYCAHPLDILLNEYNYIYRTLNDPIRHGPQLL